ncbi:MAG: hypothetical protein ACM3PT_09995 [Deltaproteobacteria bacterium]
MKEYIDFDIYHLKKSQRGKVISSGISGGEKLIILVKSRSFTDENMGFLKKIITSINIDIENECCILGLEDKNYISTDGLFDICDCKHVISFGIDIAFFDVQAKLKKRNWNNFETFSLLIFDDLSSISLNQDLKRKLWEQLKLI